MLSTVIMIDSNTELLMAYKKRLFLDGINLIVFDKAQKAISYLQTMPADLIVSEYNTDSMSVIDFIELVRFDMGLLGIPIVIFTNEDRFENTRVLEEYDRCEVVIKKATSPAAFSKKIQQYIY